MKLIFFMHFPYQMIDWLSFIRFAYTSFYGRDTKPFLVAPRSNLFVNRFLDVIFDYFFYWILSFYI